MRKFWQPKPPLFDVGAVQANNAALQAQRYEANN